MPRLGRVSRRRRDNASVEQQPFEHGDTIRQRGRVGLRYGPSSLIIMFYDALCA